MQSPAPDRCVVCGEPLAGRPYIMVDHPSAAHTDCADKNDTKDIAADELPWLRQVYREVVCLLRDVGGLGKWLATQSRTGVSRRFKTAYEYRKRKRDLVCKLSDYSPSHRSRK